MTQDLVCLGECFLREKICILLLAGVFYRYHLYQSAYQLASERRLGAGRGKLLSQWALLKPSWEEVCSFSIGIWMSIAHFCQYFGQRKQPFLFCFVLNGVMVSVPVDFCRLEASAATSSGMYQSPRNSPSGIQAQGPQAAHHIFLPFRDSLCSFVMLCPGLFRCHGEGLGGIGLLHCGGTESPYSCIS